MAMWSESKEEATHLTRLSTAPESSKEASYSLCYLCERLVCAIVVVAFSTRRQHTGKVLQDHTNTL
jgi:hypothetical protein